MELGNVLAQLRSLKGLNQRDFAQALGVSNGAVAMWETNKRQPDLEMIKKISLFFNVTVDFLLGLEKSGGRDYSNYQIDNFEFPYEFKMRIRDLMAEQKISEEEFTKRTGFHFEDKDAYLYANKMPSIEDLIKISGALNVSTDYLLEISKRKKITPEQEMLLQSFDQCDDECKKYLISKAGVLCVEGISAVAAGEPLKNTGTEHLGK